MAGLSFQFMSQLSLKVDPVLAAFEIGSDTNKFPFTILERWPQKGTLGLVSNLMIKLLDMVNWLLGSF